MTYPHLSIPRFCNERLQGTIVFFFCRPRFPSGGSAGRGPPPRPRRSRRRRPRRCRAPAGLCRARSKGPSVQWISIKKGAGAKFSAQPIAVVLRKYLWFFEGAVRTYIPKGCLVPLAPNVFQTFSKQSTPKRKQLLSNAPPSTIK